jgi:hypothetical protein
MRSLINALQMMLRWLAASDDVWDRRASPDRNDGSQGFSRNSGPDNWTH